MEKEIIIPTEFPYSVADTEEGPFNEWKNHSLILRFTDYTNQKCALKFEGVYHFGLFSDSKEGSNRYFYDSVCEIENSNIISRLLECGEITEEEKKKSKHIVIGFNEISSYLEIVHQCMKKI